MSEQKLTHLNEHGEAHMVDVSSKAETKRIARAEGYISMKAETLDLIVSGKAKKGDVLATARIAGIMAAKKTSELIPLCHPLMLTKIEVNCTPFKTDRSQEPIDSQELSSSQGVSNFQGANSSQEIPTPQGVPQEFPDGACGIRVEAICSLVGKTGVEMEALSAASIACLTIYDMCKAVDRGMEIGPIRLLHKEGGKSGTWDR